MSKVTGVVLGVLALVALVPLAWFASRSARFQRFLHDPMARVVLTVDGNSLTEGELVNALEERYGHSTAQTLIVEKAVRREADAQHVVVDPVRFKRLHEAASHRITDPGAMAWEDELIRSELLVDGLILKHVTDQARHEFYDRFKDDLTTLDISHILVSDRLQADQVYKELKAGADFASEAQAYSNDAESRLFGGHLGPLTMVQVRRTFGDDAAGIIRQLHPGVISSPIRTRFGFHVIRVDRIETSYDDLRPVIDGRLAEAQRALFMQNLRKQLGAPPQEAAADPTGAVFNAPQGQASTHVFACPDGQASSHVFSEPLATDAPSTEPVFDAPSATATTHVFQPVEKSSAHPNVFGPVDKASQTPGVFSSPQ